MAPDTDNEEKTLVESEEEEPRSNHDLEGDPSDTEEILKRKPNTSFTKRIFQNKWVTLIITLSLIGGLMVMGFKFGKQYLPGQHNEALMSPSESIKDNMREASIAPFFVPLSPGSLKNMVRVDLYVVWDGLASVRYSNKELHTRDRLYGFLTELVKKNQDLNSQVSFIEAEMSRIMRESIGVNDVVIRIMEIKAF